MESDIVERLRSIVKAYAHEIEHLREENDALKAMIKNLLAKEFEHVKVFKPKPKKSHADLQQKGE